MTKYSKMVINPLEIRAEVQKAYHIAMSGRRGPVWLDIPLDIQMAEVDTDALLYYKPNDNSYVIKDSDAVSLIRKISTSKRPVILVGQSIINSGNLDNFKRFAEKMQVPVVSNLCAGEVMARNNPTFYGVCGGSGSRTANFIIENADFILTLGTSLGFDTTGYNQDEFAKNAFITMVDVDVFEVQKPGLNVDWFIRSDLGAFFDKINNIACTVNVPAEWKKYCDNVKNRFDPFEAATNAKADERVSQYYFWKIFEQYGEDDAIFVTGNGNGGFSLLQNGKGKENQRVFTNKHCGSMGYDLPAAVGAAIGSGRTIYCPTGDGSVMMNLQELQTIKHYDLPVKVIIFSNDGYDSIRQTDKNFFNGELIGCSPETGVSFPDFGKVAETFDFPYRECRSNAEVEKAIMWLKDQDGRAILVVNEILDEPVIPRVMSRVDENGKFQTPALQDMYPFLPEEEVAELMEISCSVK